MPTVRIPTPLRQAAKGNAEVKTAGDTVDDVMADLERQFPGLRERLVDVRHMALQFSQHYLSSRWQQLPFKRPC